MVSPLLGKHDSADLVAFGAEGQRRAADLVGDVAALASALPEPGSDSEVLLVFQGDRYFFGVAFLAALSRGHGVVLPTDTRRRAIMTLAAGQQIVAVLHDTSFGAPIRVEDALGTAVPARSVRPIEIDPQVRVKLRGAAQETQSFRLEQLVAQALVLAETFGLSGTSRVVSTVPPNQSYGLVLGVLAPWLTGGALSRAMFPEAPELEAGSQPPDGGIIATAARHLPRLVRDHGEALAPYRKVIVRTPPAVPQCVLEELAARSIGPLVETVGTDWLAVAGCRPVPGPAGFGLLPGVRLATDVRGQVWVRAATATEETQEVGRLVSRRSDGRFDDFGGAAEVVTTRGTRVLLRVLEQRLAGVDGARDAVVVSLPGAAGEAGRLLVACAAAEARGPVLRREVEAFLVGTDLSYDLVCVDSLPAAEDGSCRRSDLLCLFGLDAGGRPLNYQLNWQSETRTDADGVHRCAYTVEIPTDLAYFEGHFPDYPILPAAAQLGAMVLPALRRARPELGALKRMTRLKFLRRIRPGDVVVIELRFRNDSAAADFSVRRDDTICSAGRVELDFGVPS